MQPDLLKRVGQAALTAQHLTLKASGVTERIGSGDVCSASTWSLGTSSVVRELPSSSSNRPALCLSAIPVVPHPDHTKRFADPCVSATLWLEGCLNRREVLRYIADTCDIRLADITFSTPDLVGPPATTEGSSAFRICLRNPSLAGINAVNHHSSVGAALGAKRGASRNVCRVAMGDFCAEPSPFAFTLPTESGGVSHDGRTGPATELEATVVLHNLHLRGAARHKLEATLQASVEQLRTFGFLNYHAVDPRLASAASGPESRPESRLASLLAYGASNSAAVDKVISALCDSTEPAELMAHLTADLPHHTGAVERQALNALIGCLGGLTPKEAVEGSGMAWDVIRSMVSWNRRLSERVSVGGLGARRGDWVVPHSGGSPHQLRSDSRKFTFADVVMADPLVEGRFRRVVALPSSVELHMSDSPILRLQTDPEALQSGSVASSRIMHRNDVISHFSKGGGARLGKQDLQSLQLLNPSAALSMVLPSDSHPIAACVGVLNVNVNPVAQDDRDLAALSYLMSSA
eukprot:TRINITY_DN16415_c0_g2_i1.p1 TRINITY_DN16415_c0_g2~~TRINITY_DN16415_c0_g2_i1.p1  ORF type:complete len:521 (+),score=126.84 TRINITY_DN16415_c0_g2_i1:88-1650(+)